MSTLKLSKRIFTFFLLTGLVSLMLVVYQNCGQPEYARKSSPPSVGCVGQNCVNTITPPVEISVDYLVTNGKNVRVGDGKPNNGENTCTGLSSSDIQAGLHRIVSIDITSTNFIPEEHSCLRIGPIVDAAFSNCEDGFTLDKGSLSSCTYQMIGADRRSVRIMCTDLPTLSNDPATVFDESVYDISLLTSGSLGGLKFSADPPIRIKFRITNCPSL